jgi:hypothetical protein
LIIYLFIYLFIYGLKTRNEYTQLVL